MIDMEEVERLLGDKDAENIVCREFDFKPKNIAVFIAAMASTACEYGYIVIGASKHSEGYRINGISRSFKSDGVINAALKQLSIQPSVEFQMDIIDGKIVYVICVKQLGKNIFVSNESWKDANQVYSNDALLRAVFLAYVKLQRSNLFKDVSENNRNDLKEIY